MTGMFSLWLCLGALAWFCLQAAYWGSERRTLHISGGILAATLFVLGAIFLAPRLMVWSSRV
jgi:hypothetical protein